MVDNKSIVDFNVNKFIETNEKFISEFNSMVDERLELNYGECIISQKDYITLLSDKVGMCIKLNDDRFKKIYKKVKIQIKCRQSGLLLDNLINIDNRHVLNLFFNNSCIDIHNTDYSILVYVLGSYFNNGYLLGHF